MKLESLCVLGVLLNLPALAGSTPGHRPAIGPPAVGSYEVIDPAPFNAEATRATKGGATWPRSVTEFIFHRLGISDELPVVFQVTVENAGGQDPRRLTVTAWAEGLHDDSIDGEWVYLEIEKSVEGTWSVVREHRAWRCARGGHVKSYEKEPCP